MKKESRQRTNRGEKRIEAKGGSRRKGDRGETEIKAKGELRRIGINVKMGSRRKGIEARSSRRKRQQFAKTHIPLPLDLQTGAKLEECADYKELDGGANAGRQCVCVRRFWQKLLKPWRKVTTTTVPTPRKLTYAEKCSSKSVFFDRGRQMNNRW